MRTIFTFLSLTITSVLFSQSLWTAQDYVTRSDVRIKTTKAEFYSLNFAELKSNLSTATNEYSRGSQDLIIQIPLTGGKMESFKIFQTNTLSQGLQSKYPEINNYIIQSVDHPGIYGRIDVTYQGFHAIIKTGADYVYIDPALDRNTQNYMVYNRKDAINTKTFHCYSKTEDITEQMEVRSARISDNKMRTYRMALSCTGEYAQFHGGTVPLVLSAMNTTINRVNFVYEQEYAVRFEIIANTDLLINLNPLTDPYDNDDIDMQLDQNQIECDIKIGNSNYDIGHIFSTGGGGLAGYAVACKSNTKAWGGTGSSKPINDPFDIDYVAHEVGHQLSGSHTQNNKCNRDESASYEPGSASTIMGYAGICSPNVQNNSDAYFHGYSIEEMSKYIVNGTGNQCPTKTSLDGTIPVITESTGNYTIPKLTPFELKAKAEGDQPLIFQWDQLDNAVAEVQPPKSTNTKGPLFRSYWGDNSGVRTFPAINYIVKNLNNTWEALPGVKRDVNFILTVKEDKPGGANHAQKKNKLSVDNTAGPFVVTYPNDKFITWFVGEGREITWDVAKTDAGNVKCKNVNILLSDDGGYNYPYLIATVPNSGSAYITVPDYIGTTMRIKVAAADNVFFDISNEDFEIKAGLQPFSIDMDVPASDLCKGDSLVFFAKAGSPDQNTDTIHVTANYPTSGFTVSIENTQFLDVDSIRIVIYNNGAGTATNNFEFFFEANGNTILRQVTVRTYGIPATPTLFNPVNYTENVNPNAKFSWNPVAGQPVTYDLEVATDINFTNIVAQVHDVAGVQTVLPENLANNTDYYWRVRCNGVCENSSYSDVYVIRTSTCSQFYTNPGIGFELNEPEVKDSIKVTNLPFDKLQSLEVIGIAGHFSEVGNIKARLTNSEQKSAILWNNDCTGEKDIRLRFADNAYSTEIPCDTSSSQYGLGDLAIQPVEALARFNTSPPENTYSLIFNLDDVAKWGYILSWGLNLCGNAPTCNPLRIPLTTRLYTADLACTDDNGWTNYSITAANNPGSNTDLMVMSIKFNGEEPLSPEQVQVRIPSAAKFIKINNAQYVANPSTWTVLNRYWLLSPETQPSSPVEVRFYLTDSEITSLLDAAGLSGETDSLKVFSVFSNDSIDANPVNKHLKIKEGDVQQHTFELGTYNLNKYIQFSLDYLSDGCVGAGGEILKTNNTKKTRLSNVKFYPNPASQSISIKGMEGKGFVHIYDITGQKIGAKAITGNTEIDLSQLSVGTYIFKIINEKGEHIEKVTILR